MGNSKFQMSALDITVSEGSSRVMSLWAINTLQRMIRDLDVYQD